MTARPDPWLATLRDAATGEDTRAVLGALARHLAADRGPDLVAAVAEAWPATTELPAAGLPSGGDGVPDALGWAYEALADEDQRRRGLHYTPRPLAERLVAIGLDGLCLPLDGGDEPFAVCDPACGGGAFLLAAARRLASSGVGRRAVVERHLVGVDIDPLAAAVASTALLLWAGGPPVVPQVVVADALATVPWPHRPESGFDLVVGNPPFQSQLSTRTARTAGGAERVRHRFGADVTGYVDTAALFLLAATDEVRPGGRVLLIQPQSVLAGRDAGPVRRAVDERVPLEGLWLCDERVFAAHTRVCAPVLRRPAEGAARPAGVRRWRGPSVRRAKAGRAPAPGRWAPLAAGLRDTPTVRLGGGPLPELAGATAGFRDQFYGLVDHVHEATGADHERLLVTSGLIDPAECAWGQRDLRFAKRRWRAPVVDLASLGAADPALAAWVADRLVPKVLVATQTRVVEAVADVEGRWVPSTPVLSVPAEPDRLWHVLAALLAPPVSAWALHLSAGAALAPDALKLSAAQVRGLPAPVDDRAWDEGAAAARAAQASTTADDRLAALEAMGRAMVVAHGITGASGASLLDWWSRRLPTRSFVARSDIGGGGQ